MGTVCNRLFVLAALGCAALSGTASAETDKYSARMADWRNGAVVYQILVDRFAPSADLAAKARLYPAPKRLKSWNEVPLPGVELADQKLNSQELDFWGGDLPSATARLDYIQSLGADVVYLNPIHLAYTNHKYDALDFKQISPEYGTRDDFRRFAAQAHQRHMKVILDGVFNHMGRNSRPFQEAMADPASPWRHWFAIGPQYRGGARVWTGYQNLPELNLEYRPVRDYLYGGRDSVVRGYLRDGADGWRLDTAFELGPDYLSELTRAAHEEKKSSLVIGEIANYPSAWAHAMDAVMNFTQRQIILGLASGDIAPSTAGKMTARMIADTGIEAVLKSWVLIDNHDIPRLATQFPDQACRRMVQTLQFTLPGTPNLYYGSELGMTGGPDPENRGPMRWDLVTDANPELQWTRQLIGLRKRYRALRVGDFRLVETDHLMAFERHTDRALETVLVFANPTGDAVTERVLVANPALMDETPMVDLLGDRNAKPLTVINSGMMTVTVPARTTLVLGPVERDLGGYSRYKRVH
jgi:glycosidase